MILTGTGHRPTKLYKTYQGESYIIQTIESILPSLDVELGISGMALGFDIALAKVFVKQNIPWVAAIPFEGQENRWFAASIQEYNHLLGLAKEVVYVDELNNEPPGYSAAKMQRRNEYMVDRADVVLALWNGSPGGTANCVHYAGRKQKQVINIWDKYLKITGWK